MGDALSGPYYFLRQDKKGASMKKAPGRNDHRGQWHLIKPRKLLDIGVNMQLGAARFVPCAVKLFGPHFSDDALPSPTPRMRILEISNSSRPAGLAINGRKNFRSCQ